MSKLSVNQLYRQIDTLNVADLCYRISMKTGVLAAASVGAGGVLFAMRPMNAGASVLLGFVERIRLQYTCITPFAVPITAGRSIAISGGNDIAASGGTQLVTPICKGGSGLFSIFQQALGGETWIANAGPLAGATVKANSKLAELSLAGFGTAGASVDKTFIFSGDESAPVGLSRTETLRADNTDLVVYAPQAMDLAGTFELIVEVDTCELPRT